MGRSHVSRRRWLQSTASLGVAAVGSVGAQRNILRAAGAPAMGIVSGRRQLFFDDAHIQESHGLTRTMHQPVKRGAVVMPDQSWETSLQTRCVPAWDERRGIYKLWMITSTNLPDPNTKGATVAGTTYAESEDGIVWRKPVLRQWRVNGSLENNFVAVNPQHSWPQNGIENVVCDPDDPDPARRYKGFYGVHGRRPMVGPDGVHWRLLEAPKLPSSDESNLSYDRRRRTFIATLKRGGPHGRSHAIWSSRDFSNWNNLQILFHADEIDQQRAVENINARLADQRFQQPVHRRPSDYNADIYNLGIFAYEDWYIGMPAVYHATGKVPSGNTDGFHLIQLACSRDLRSWERLGDRRPFIGPSPVTPNAWDRVQLLPPSAPVVRGDELWFYYTGIKYRTRPADSDEKSGAVCLAVLRRDGFVSLGAGNQTGSLTTRPFRWPSGTLHLNVDAAQGEVHVAVLDADRRVLGRSEPIRGNRLAAKVSLESPIDTNRPVALQLMIRDAQLYSYWFADG